MGRGGRRPWWSAGKPPVAANRLRSTSSGPSRGSGSGSRPTKMSPATASTPVTLPTRTPATSATAKTWGPVHRPMASSHRPPDLHLHPISTLGDELRKIETQHDHAAAAARADGLSRDKIGRAFGITRQVARKRWELCQPSKGVTTSNVCGCLDALRFVVDPSGGRMQCQRGGRAHLELHGIRMR